MEEKINKKNIDDKTNDVVKNNENKVTVEINDKRDSAFTKGKKIISYIFSLGLFVFIVIAAITIKNGFDDTVSIVEKQGNDICQNETCIVFDSIYKDGFVNWNIKDYWPLFAISINTDVNYTQDQKVDIVCPVELNNDSFQYLFAKLGFIIKKQNVQTCKLMSNNIS